MENIVVNNDVCLKEKDNVVFHFKYEEKLTLKELAELLELTNKAINAFNRENGVKSNSTLGKKYVPEVNAVKEGSVIVELAITCASNVMLSVLGAFIYDKLKTLGSSEKQKKKETYKYPIDMTVNGDNNNIKSIDIHIHNHS